jgi:hypothetical protein
LRIAPRQYHHTQLKDTNEQNARSAHEEVERRHAHWMPEYTDEKHKNDTAEDDDDCNECQQHGNHGANDRRNKHKEVDDKEDKSSYAQDRNATHS